MQPVASWEFNSDEPIEQRRRFSPLLAAFPWQWSGIVDEPQCLSDFADALPQHRNFITCLHRYETHLFKFHGLHASQQLLHSLGLQMTYPTRPEDKWRVAISQADELSVGQYLDVCSFLCGYKYFEYIALRAGYISRISTPRSPSYPQLYLPKVKLRTEKPVPYGFDKLADWIASLYSFKSVVEKHSAKSRDPSLPLSNNPFVALLGMLSDNEVKGSYNAIENNFIRAAMHIGAMEMIIFPEEIMPDLPGDLGKLGYRTGPSSEEHASDAPDIDLTVSTIYQYEFRDDSSSAGAKNAHITASFRSALHLALLLSPLYLSLHFLISKKSFNRRSVLELAAKLGPHKPPLLLKIEGLFIDALIRLSKGRTLPSRVLKDLVASIPWAEVDKASHTNDRHWFDIERRPSHEIGSVSSSKDLASGLCITPSHPHLEALGSSEVTSALDPLPSMDTYEPFCDVSTTSPVETLEDSHMALPANPIQDFDVGSSAPDIEISLASSLAASINESFGAHRSPTSLPDPFSGDGTLSPFDVTMQHPSPSDSLHSEDESTFASPLPSPRGSTAGIGPFPVVDDVDIVMLDADGSRHSGLPPPDNTVSPRDEALDESDTEDDEDSSSESSDRSDAEDDGGSSSESSDRSENDSTYKDKSSNKKGKASNGHSDHPKPPAPSPLKPKPKPKPKSRASRPSKSKEPPSDKAPGSSALRDKGVTPTPSSQDKRTQSEPQNKSSTPLGGASSSRLSAGGSLADPIDVDLYTSLFEPTLVLDYEVKELISLSTDKPPRRIKSDVMFRAYDAEGTPVEFFPEFHYQVYHSRLRQFLARVQEHYIDNLPRHVSTPALSSIRILSYEIFIGMDTVQLSAAMLRKHLVVTGCPVDDEVKFDEDGLTLLASLPRKISMHDYSVKPAKGTCGPAVVCGRVDDMLKNANENGKILNALDFPLFDGSRALNAFAVDLAAWHAVRGLHTTLASTPYPTEHMKWGTAGHENSFTLLHIDCDGFATDIGPECGEKLWGVLSPRKELPLSSINFFLDPGFCLDGVLKSSNYDFEAIVLRPGDRLYMLPSTPHFVLGLKNTICLGGHYYATCLMQRTLQALIHAFVLNKFLTNTQHQPSRQLLRRIILFYHIGLVEGQISLRNRTAKHLPDVDSIEGLLNLLSTAILVLLGNVLDFRTYSAPNQHHLASFTEEQLYLMKTFDINSITHNERQAICYARGVALFIIRWIRSECVIKGPSGVVVDDLPSMYLVQILSALLAYKKAAVRLDRHGAPHCTFDFLSAQVENVVRCDIQLRNAWMSRPSQPATSLALESKALYSVEWNVGWEPAWRSQETDFFTLGLTPFDQAYFEYQNDRCLDETADIASKVLTATQTSKKRKVF